MPITFFNISASYPGCETKVNHSIVRNTCTPGQHKRTRWHCLFGIEVNCETDDEQWNVVHQITGYYESCVPIIDCTLFFYYCEGSSSGEATNSTVQHRPEIGHDINGTSPTQSNVYASFTMNDSINDTIVYLCLFCLFHYALPISL